MNYGSLAVVEGWLDAINQGDADRLAELSHETVLVAGPRGTRPADRAELGAWLTRAGFSSIPRRWFCGGNGTVVVDQDARWQDVTTAEPQDRLRIASVFTVADGRVATYARFDTGLRDALTSAGLDEQRDEVTARSGH